MPISFGLKVATWLDELIGVHERLTAMTPRVLCVQLFGAAGTMAAYGAQASAVKANVASALGLANPLVPWHATRDRMADLASVMAALAACAERVALEVIRLQSTEYGEVTEPLMPGHIGSSTMPQKRNPHLSEGIVAKARLVHSNAGLLSSNGGHAHERDMGAWAVEWMAVPVLMGLSGAVARDLCFLLGGLTVDTHRMTLNLELTRGQILSESLMMALAPKLGRNVAHALLIKLTRQADADGVPLADVLQRHEQILSACSETEIAELLNIGSHTGLSAELVDSLVARVESVEAGARLVGSGA